jgi:hypothetical protein
MRARICLDTLRDVNEFVRIATSIAAPVYITDGSGLKVSAKSMIGVMYSLEFNEIWCECEEDIYSSIADFIVI